MFLHVLVFLIKFVMKSASVDVQCNRKRDTGFWGDHRSRMLIVRMCSKNQSTFGILFSLYSLCGDLFIKRPAA